MRLPWRNAAVIICAAPKKMTTNSKIITDPRVTVDPDVATTTADPLSVLLVKRHADSKVMPGVYTFPGGAVDDTDFDVRWTEEYFQQYRKEQRSQWTNIIKSVETMPFRIPAFEMYRNKSPFSSNSNKSPFSLNNSLWTPAEWAFKIAALRELFEECGLLVCFDKRTYDIQYLSTTGKGQDSLESDRQAVHADAKQFWHVCQKRSIIPAFWMLREWSNWLSPTSYKAPARFDSVFYTLRIDQALYVEPDTQELEKAEWVVPKKALASGILGQIVLAPPQIYELARLSKFRTCQDLDTFAVEREQAGMARYCPILIKCSDGVTLACLPGDDLYDESVDLTLSCQPYIKLDETSDQMLEKAKNLHRLAFKPPHWGKGKYHCNIEQPCKQIGPV